MAGLPNALLNIFIIDHFWRAMMKNFTATTKFYIFTTILLGILVLGRYLPETDWSSLGVYILAGLATIGQVLKLEGPTARSHYNLGWLVYGFTLVSLGLPAALFVILVAHLVEWLWHKYPWYIQTFNIGVYVIAMAVASWIYHWILSVGTANQITSALAILIGLAAFTMINHWMVGMVIKLARGQSFAESGVFDSMPLMIDFVLLGMGAGTALVWSVNPFAVVLNVIPLYLIHNAMRVPALQRQVEVLEASLKESETSSVAI
jgi:hypothetical protein